jgi:hypothetical protein
MGLPGQDRTSPFKGMSGISDVRGSGLPGSFDPPMSSPDSYVAGDDEEERPSITDDERRQLRERGFAECDIRALTLAQVHDILNPKPTAAAFLGKVVITQADKAHLLERGYSTAQIKEMKPEDVQAILEQPGRSVTKWGVTFSVIGPAAPGSTCLYCKSAEPDESGAVMMIQNHGRLHEDCAPAWINNSNRSK